MSSKLFNFVLGLTFASFVAAGCAVPDKGHIAGCIMLDVGHEGRVVAHDGKVNATKTGKGTQSSILGWITSGDSSIEFARNADGADIKQISHIDYHASHILGIIGDCTTIVYGQ
ncbi:MAG: TRL-like protein family [Planctomycetes bacterium]|nr:TRL-like protein family [Planctomycetota bacterium]